MKKLLLITFAILALGIGNAQATDYLIESGYFGDLGLVNNDTLLMTGGWGDSLSLTDSAIATIENTDLPMGIWGITSNDISTVNINGGKISLLRANQNSTVTINNGLIDSQLSAYDSSTVTINDGTIGGIWAGYSSTVKVRNGTIIGDIEPWGNSKIEIIGGSIGGDVESWGNSIVEVSGGTVGTWLQAYGNGTIYLDGSEFNINGQNLSFGDSLRDYGTIGEGTINGIVIGTLQDGSALNNYFTIQADSLNADIIIIPEPTNLLLFGLGSLWLRKKR
jgi:hypothetical protein